MFRRVSPAASCRAAPVPSSSSSASRALLPVACFARKLAISSSCQVWKPLDRTLFASASAAGFWPANPYCFAAKRNSWARSFFTRLPATGPFFFAITASTWRGLIAA